MLIVRVQLADFLRVPLERAGGMMTLPDVYCLFNRARGTELVSPDDLLQVSSNRCCFVGFCQSGSAVLLHVRSRTCEVNG